MSAAESDGIGHGVAVSDGEGNGVSAAESDGIGHGGVAVLLVNTGSPAAPTPPAVRRYLRQFLRDRRLIQVPRPIWRAILECFILPVRGRRSAAKYRLVWGPDGSPLAAGTEALAAGVQAALGDVPGMGPVRVLAAMRYGTPGVRATLERLRAEGVGRVLVLPLYPQHSQTTVGTVIDEVARDALAAHNQLEVRWIRGFATAPAYIEACAAQIEAAWAQDGRPDFAAGARLLLSFHSIPVSLAKAGDPYAAESRATARAIRTRLALTEDQAPLVYQSKFGPAAWLTPTLFGAVAELGAAGVARADVFCPGFMVDCLETLEEVDVRVCAAFLTAGGRELRRVPCLNGSPQAVAAVTALVRRHLAGWDAGRE
jgi:ferrochelatase